MRAYGIQKHMPLIKLKALYYKALGIVDKMVANFVKTMPI